MQIRYLHGTEGTTFKVKRTDNVSLCGKEKKFIGYDYDFLLRVSQKTFYGGGVFNG